MKSHKVLEKGDFERMEAIVKEYRPEMTGTAEYFSRLYRRCPKAFITLTKDCGRITGFIILVPVTDTLFESFKQGNPLGLGKNKIPYEYIERKSRSGQKAVIDCVFVDKTDSRNGTLGIIMKLLAKKIYERAQKNVPFSEFIAETSMDTGHQFYSLLGMSAAKELPDNSTIYVTTPDKLIESWFSLTMDEEK